MSGSRPTGTVFRAMAVAAGLLPAAAAASVTAAPRTAVDAPASVAAAPRAPADAPGAASPPSAEAPFCALAAPPPYYAFELVTTARLPGTARATGEATVAFAPSPYGVTLADDGSYLLDVTVELQRLPEPAGGTYVAWVTTTEVDRIAVLGVVEAGRARGQVAWNKFLVVVTLEPELDPDATTWSGPIVLRGMSRSGMMHTMAGHGPYQQENCAAYGYEE